MPKRSVDFNISFSNVPLLNLRFEFNAHHDLLADVRFRSLFDPGAIIQPLRTPFMVWGGMPGAFLTLLLQRAFSGIEAYVVGAAHISASGLDSDSLRKVSAKLADPFSLDGRGVVENYFHLVPSLVDSSFSLKHHSADLWRRTKRLYADVRNPLFHGYEVVAECVGGVFNVFDHLADQYRWIDSWCDPESVMPGAGKTLPPRPRGAA